MNESKRLAGGREGGGGRLPWLVAGLIVSLGFGLSGVAAADEPLWSDGTAGGHAAGDPLNFGAFADLSEAASPAVVNINAALGQRSVFGGSAGLSQGSGFLVTSRGHVVTNNHVIESSSEVQVRLSDGREFTARLLGADPQTDLALLQIDVDEPLPFLPLGDSSRVRVGDWVIAVGNPFGLEHTVTAGIVSAIGRRGIRPEGRDLLADFIQTDASINPGSSGGPLIDIHGNVVAVNTAINPRGNNVGFAIPINMVKALLPQLAAGEVSRSWLGVAVDRVTPQLARERGLERARGALITRVTEGGPAAAAGMEVGDIVLHFNGQPVRDNFELPWLAAVAGVGSMVLVEVSRGETQLALTVEMGAPLVASSAPVSGRPLAGGFRGESLADVEEDKDGLPERGVLVRSVDDSSIADRAGLRAGDVITECAGHPVLDADGLHAALESSRPNGVVRMRVLRGRAVAMVTLRY